MVPAKTIASITSIASAVREWCEVEAYSHRSSEFDFYKTSCLSCMCAYASTLLLHALHHAGHTDAILRCNDRHAHVYFHGLIIDITATQFGSQFSPVEIASERQMKRRVSNKHDVDAWSECDSFETTEAAYGYLNPASGEGFPPEQYWSSITAMKMTTRRLMKAISDKIETSSV